MALNLLLTPFISNTPITGFLFSGNSVIYIFELSSIVIALLGNSHGKTLHIYEENCVLNTGFVPEKVSAIIAYTVPRQQHIN